MKNRFNDRIIRLERAKPRGLDNLDRMSDEQLAVLAGFPAGYVPSDAELEAIAREDSIPCA